VGNKWERHSEVQGRLKEFQLPQFNDREIINNLNPDMYGDQGSDGMKLRTSRQVAL
jgi:hypothetical protein